MAYSTSLLSNSAVQVEATALSTSFNSGYCSIYDNSGAMPSTADAPIVGNILLITGQFAANACASIANGVITFNSLTWPIIANTGVAFMYRTLKSDGITPISQGTVGTNGQPIANSVYNMSVNSTSLSANASFSTTSFTHTVAQ
jgi:hypothetical protein